MSRKERNQEAFIKVDPVEQYVDDALLEAEAYGSPQPEAGSDVTVMKPVGIGGPVPIVAPKHNTIQLQPIVVPLAVVPYMTQDSNVLRTDARQAGGYIDNDEYAEITQFESVTQQTRTKKKRKNLLPRIFALVSLVFTVVMLLPFLISYSTGEIGAANITSFNIINIISVWANTKFSWTPATNLIYIVVAFLTAVQVILLLIGAIIGKYPKPMIPIFSFINMGCLLGVLITEIVGKNFVASNEVGFIVVFCFSVVCFILSVVFSVILNHREDRAEMENKRKSEI